jgi:hypothetical protein
MHFVYHSFNVYLNYLYPRTTQKNDITEYSYYLYIYSFITFKELLI